jgi:hypothetical protein
MLRWCKCFFLSLHIRQGAGHQITQSAQDLPKYLTDTELHSYLTVVKEMFYHMVAKLLGQYMWYDKIIVLLYCCESILRASHDWLGMIMCI